MTDFDIIEYGYNIADETINFGTRNLADGDNLHEAATLATLKCSETSKGISSPHINAVAKSGRIFCNVGASMKVFKDKECSDIDFNANFDAIIDTFSVNNNNLLICLRNGTLHLVNCNNDYQVSCSIDTIEDCEALDVADRFFISSFLYASDFLIVTRKGHLIRITIINDQKMEAEYVHDFSFLIAVASFQYPFLLVNGTKLSIVDIRNKLIISDEDCEWKFKKILPLNYMFLGLDFEGHLFRICAITLVGFPLQNSTLYDDFLVMSESSKIHLVAVTKGDCEQSQIQLLSYPDLSVVFSLKISTDVHLITPEFLNDELLYISKISTENGVNELRFHVVYETEAEQRLRRLLKKRKYEEAEKFAKIFNLDLSIINKAKVQAIVDTSLCDSKDVDNLISLLNLIDDDEFKLQACLDVESSCSHLEDVRKILKYGCELPLKKQNKQGVDELQKSIINLMFRFDTFMAIYRGNDCDMQYWIQFDSYNLINELKSFLKNCQIEEAKIIYSRLDELTVKKMTEEQIADILNILNNIPIATYQPFLPTFIPISLSILPSTLPLFVRWTYGKVFHLEKRSKADFPNNAIKFTENIVALMKVDDVNDISFQRQCIVHRDSFTELSRLLSTLKSLKALKDDYRITIPVNDYLSGPETVIRILLNVEMYPEEFDSLLKNFLSKFMLEHRLEPNEIFLSEIVDLMKYEEQYWVNVVRPILNCISSVAVKLEAVKTILDSASVPWCSMVRDIANESLKYSHPLVLKIKELIEKEPMQVVLRKPKYKIKEKRITDINILKFVVNRVIYCGDDNMVEDVFRLCKTQEERHVTNVLVVTRLIRDGCFEKAMELLNNNTPQERFNCAEELVMSVESALNGEIRISDEIRDNYYHVAGALFKRLIDGSKNQFERTCHQEKLKLLRNVHSLRKNFRIKTTSFELRRSENKNKILEDVLEETNQLFETDKRTVQEVFSICQKIAASLSLDVDEVLMKFCEKSGNYGFVLETARKIYHEESSSKNLCLMAVLLLKYLGVYKLQLSDDSFSESDSTFSFDNDSVDNNDIFLDGLQLAHKIVEKAIFTTTPEDVSACVEVANWVNTSFYSLKHKNNDLKKKLFSDIYDSGSIIPGFLTFSCIRTVFNSYCNFIGLFNNPNDMYLTYFKADKMTEADLFKIVKQLSTTVENLCKEGQHFTSFKIVSTLQSSLKYLNNFDEKIIIYLSTILKKYCIPKLLSSILSNNVINTDLLYNLLLVCDRDDAIQFVMYSLRMYKRHPRKFSSIIQVGLRFWKHHDLTSGHHEMMKSLITLKWWKKFDNKQFNYDNFFKCGPDERFELLISANCLDKNLIEEYSKDYDLSMKLCYSCYLKRTFLNWTPDYEIKTDISNKKHLIVKNDEDTLLKKCQEIMTVLERQQILNIINGLWGSVNKYYYEVLITMLTILTEINPNEDNSMKINMLLFLKNYQRVSKPSEMETENWYTNFPDTQSLDPLSEFRLPFTEFLFTRQIWSIIRPEINLKTYKLWFDAIDIVAPFLNKNDICSYVVKDLVASGVLSKDTAEEWVLYPKHEDLFSEIEECVRHISDLERTTSVVYYLLTHTPNGADQVIAATLCYKYALSYKKSNSGSSDVEKAFVKIQKKYFSCHAMHILHTYQLTEKKYVNLVTQPNELILALYLDERILKKSECVDLHCPDINRATEALASLFNLDIKSIRHTLIENWLLDCPTSSFDFDSSMVFPQKSSNDLDNLKRAAYACCAEDTHFWQTYLIHIGLGDETNEQKSVSCRAKALKVFAMISDVEVIAQITELTYDEFMNFIDKLTLVSNLEYLGISLDVEALDAYSKKELLNRLAQRGGNILTIQTMAGICMTYNMYDIKYWEFILNSSIKFSMFTELKSYIYFLKAEKYHNKRFYINAWQKLIENSFMSLSTFQGEQLNEVLLHNFLMIQSCPVLYSLKFNNLLRKCIDIGKVEFAAVLLQYVNEEQREMFVKEILQSNKDFTTELNVLAQKGLWGIHHVQVILAGGYKK